MAYDNCLNTWAIHPNNPNPDKERVAALEEELSEIRKKTINRNHTQSNRNVVRKPNYDEISLCLPQVPNSFNDS